MNSGYDSHQLNGTTRNDPHGAQPEPGIASRGQDQSEGCTKRTGGRLCRAPDDWFRWKNPAAAVTRLASLVRDNTCISHHATNGMASESEVKLLSLVCRGDSGLLIHEMCLQLLLLPLEMWQRLHAIITIELNISPTGYRLCQKPGRMSSCPRVSCAAMARER